MSREAQRGVKMAGGDKNGRVKWLMLEVNMTNEVTKKTTWE